MATQNSVNDIYVPLAGGTMTGLLILSGDPTNPLGAVTKEYADAIAASIDFKDAVVAATTAALTATYSNGVSGVGATLTNAGAQAAFSIDGQTPSTGARVLIKNQSSTFQNGAYNVTVPGTGATNWVLTRTTDYNMAPSEVYAGTAFPVTAGTVNGSTIWVETASPTAIDGVQAITFAIFQSAPLTLPVAVTNGGTGVATLTTPYGVLTAGTTATGNVQTLAALGTAGTVLTSNGASALPSFQAVAAGSSGLTWIASATASGSATINFSNDLTSTYDNYEIWVENVVPATTSTYLQTRVGTGAGPSYQATNYVGCCCSSNASNGAQTAASGTTAGDLTPNNVPNVNTSTTGTGGIIRINNINNASNYKNISANLVVTSASPFTGHAYPGLLWEGATVLTSIQFFFSSGNISTGTFKLYGVQN